MKLKYRWYPPTYTKIDTPADLPVEILVSETLLPTGDWKHYAIAYSGKRTKNDFHHSFRTTEQRDQYIAKYLDNMRDILQRKADRKAKRLRAPNNLQVGDILHYSWGWEQTNCQFYQVTARTAKTVNIQEIHSARVEGSMISHGMACYVRPSPDEWMDKAEIKGKLVQGDEGNYVTMDYGNATRCAPDQKFYSSWYA
jgi:hypothetical protein